MPCCRGAAGGPLLDNPDTWWVNIFGRLKPGVTDVQAERALQITLRDTVRATLPDRVDRDQPHLRLLPGARGLDNLQARLRQAAVRAAVARRLRAAARVYERREPAAGARVGAAAGTEPPAGARRGPGAADAAVADRRARARPRRRRARPAVRLLDARRHPADDRAVVGGRANRRRIRPARAGARHGGDHGDEPSCSASRRSCRPGASTCTRRSRMADARWRTPRIPCAGARSSSRRCACRCCS